LPNLYGFFTSTRSQPVSDTKRHTHVVSKTTDRDSGPWVRIPPPPLTRWSGRVVYGSSVPARGAGGTCAGGFSRPLRRPFALEVAR
jgi:hypothetical protein